MSELSFLSPSLAAPDAVWRSPLERALAEAPTGVDDLSSLGKIEVRGPLPEVDAEVVPITDGRSLVLCPPERTQELLGALGAEGFAVDLSAAYAGLAVRGESLLRRLTDLDLERLPAVGPVAHVQALLLRGEEEGSFRLFFPQEYGDHVAHVVLDALAGLEPR